MDMKQLRYFLQIVEVGSISSAAELLHIAQPSLSHHVRALEEELGVTLLTRHARGVVATEFGLLLCEHARTILREAELTKQVIRTASGNPVGEVMVGLPTSVCKNLTRPLTDAIQARYPNITLHIVEAMSGSLDEWVQSGRLHVALLYDHKAFDRIKTREILIEDLYLILSTDSPHVAESITLEQMVQLPLVLPSRPHILRSVMEQLASKMGITLNVVMACDSLSGIIDLVKHGRATVYPLFTVNEELSRNELVAIPITDPTPFWRMSIVQSQQMSNLRAAEAVSICLYQIVRNLVQEGTWKATLKAKTK